MCFSPYHDKMKFNPTIHRTVLQLCCGFSNCNNENFIFPFRSLPIGARTVETIQDCACTSGCFRATHMESIYARKWNSTANQTQVMSVVRHRTRNKFITFYHLLYFIIFIRYQSSLMY